MSKKPKLQSDKFDYQGKKRSSYSSSAIIFFCSVIALITFIVTLFIKNFFY